MKIELKLKIIATIGLHLSIWSKRQGWESVSCNPALFYAHCVDKSNLEVL